VHVSPVSNTEVHVSASAVAEPMADTRDSVVLEASAEQCKGGSQTRGAEAQDLVQASREDDAPQFRAKEHAPPFRLRLDRLSIARH
jgi:hypothetical protein